MRNVAVPVLLLLLFVLFANSSRLHAVPQTPGAPALGEGGQGVQWIDGTPLLRRARGGATLPPPASALAVTKEKTPLRRPLLSEGDTEWFWVVDFGLFMSEDVVDMNEVKVLIEAEVVRVTEHAYFFVELGIFVEYELLEQLIDEFEANVYPADTRVFGEPPDALDGDPRLCVVVTSFPGTSMEGATAAGYFDDANQYTDAEALHYGLGHSCEREIIYVNKDFVRVDPWTGEFDRTGLGVFAHELQHLIHWRNDPDEDVWLNEACSEYAMHVTGYEESTGQHEEFYVTSPYVSMTEWSDDSYEALSQYGGVYFFLRYLSGRFGGEAVPSRIARDALNGVESVDAWLRAEHGLTFREAFRDWAIASSLNESSGKYAYDFDHAPYYWRWLYESFEIHKIWPIFFTERYESFDAGTWETWMPRWANEFYLFSRAAGESGDPFHGAFQVLNGPWFVQMTYLGLDRTGMAPAWDYELKHTETINLDASGYGEFDIPSDDDHFILILHNLTRDDDETTRGPVLEYRLGVYPGEAGYVVIDQTPPSPVQDLAVEGVDSTQADLTWTTPGDDLTSGIACLYDLRWSTATLTADNFLEAGTRVPSLSHPLAPGTTESLTVRELAPSSTVHFLMAVDDEAGNRAWSNPLSVETGPVDLIAPARVTDLEDLTTTGTSVVLAWTAPGDDAAGEGPAREYDIRWSETPIADVWTFRHGHVVTPPEPAEPGVRQQATLDLPAGPGPDRTFYVALRARDEAGNLSAISNMVTLGTPRTGSPPGVWVLYD